MIIIVDIMYVCLIGDGARDVARRLGHRQGGRLPTEVM